MRRLKEFFTGNIVKSDDVELIAVIEESAHKKFENEVSQNGRLKGCTDHVIKEKDYINKLLKKVDFKNKETLKSAQEILQIANDYIKSKI